MEKIKRRYGKYLVVNENENKEAKVFLKFFNAFKDRFPEEFIPILTYSIEEISDITNSRLAELETDRYDCIEELSAYIHSSFIDLFYDFALEYFKEHECFSMCHNLQVLQEAIEKFRENM